MVGRAEMRTVGDQVGCIDNGLRVGHDEFKCLIEPIISPQPLYVPALHPSLQPAMQGRERANGCTSGTW